MCTVNVNVSLLYHWGKCSHLVMGQDWMEKGDCPYRDRTDRERAPGDGPANRRRESDWTDERRCCCDLHLQTESDGCALYDHSSALYGVVLP